MDQVDELKKKIWRSAEFGLPPWLVIILVAAYMLLTFPQTVQKYNPWLNKFQPYLSWLLPPAILFVYNRHEHRVRQEIISTRKEFARLEQNQNASVRAVCDQDTQIYISNKMGPLQAEMDEVTRSRGKVVWAANNTRDYNAHDGYSNFNREAAIQKYSIDKMKHFVLRTYGLQWPKENASLEIQEVDLSTPPRLHERYQSSEREYQIALHCHRVVTIESGEMAQATIVRIEERLSRGAPWL